MMGFENDNTPLIAGDSVSEKPKNPSHYQSKRTRVEPEVTPVTNVDEVYEEFKSDMNAPMGGQGADETYYVENKTNKLIDFNA